MTDQLQIDDNLIYRLKNGVNFDEINITLWGGSRQRESRKEGARRVLACVNSCVGIPTEHLELCGEDFLGHYTAMRDVEELVKQRNELLAAAKELRSICTEAIPEFNIPRINDIIEKVEA
jgi:hypothetical protein